MRAPRIVTATAALAASALALAACSSASVGGTDDSAATTMTTVTIDTTSMSGANEIAKIGGFFEEEFDALGINIEYTTLGTSTQMLEGLASRALDFTDIGYVAVATGGAAGVPITILGQASSGGGDAVLVQPGGPTSVEDLAGLTVATAKGSSAWALLVRALDEAGMSTDDIELIDLAPDEAQNAFLTGQIDAWALWVGTKTDAVNDDNSETLVTGDDLGLIPGAILTRSALLDSDMAVVEAFLRARQAAVDWLAEDPTAVAEAIAEDRNVDLAVAKTFLAVSTPVNAPTSSEVEASYQATAVLFYELGEISDVPDIASLIENGPMENIVG